MEALATGITVDADGARQDHIEIDVQRWAYRGTYHEFAAFTQRLCGTFSVEGGERQIFTSQGGTERRPIWTIKGGVGGVGYTTKPGTALFSGRLRGYQSEGAYGDPEIKNWTLKAELSLNPTRAMIYEKQLAVLARLDRENRLSVPATLFARNHPHWNGVIPLVHGDNVAIGSERIMSLFAPSNWGLNVRRYWLGVLNLFNDILREAADEAGGGIYEMQWKLTLKSLETYWEFKDSNPVATVAALERPFRSLACRSSVAWHELAPNARQVFNNRRVKLGNLDNSPVITVYPAMETSLKAYAKTTDRIRFEVRHKKGSSAIRQYTSADTAGLLYWMDRAALDGARRVNDMLIALGNVIVPPATYQHSPQRFIFDIDIAVGDRAKAMHLVELLVANGKLEKGPGAPLGPAIQRLVDAGILRRVRSKASIGIFRVTNLYIDALEVLHKARQ